MSQKSLEQSPNAYDLQAIQPIEEILQKYFCNIDKAFEFQEASLNEKKGIIRTLALDIDHELHSESIHKKRIEQYQCKSYYDENNILRDCICNYCK